jgi:hypothetical protein
MKFLPTLESLNTRDVPSATDVVSTTFLGTTDNPAVGVSLVTYEDASQSFVFAEYNSVSGQWTPQYGQLADAATVHEVLTTNIVVGLDPGLRPSPGTVLPNPDPTTPIPLLDEYYQLRYQVRDEIQNLIEIKQQMETTRNELNNVIGQLIQEEGKANPDPIIVQALRNRKAELECRRSCSASVRSRANSASRRCATCRPKARSRTSPMSSCSRRCSWNKAAPSGSGGG